MKSGAVDGPEGRQSVPRRKIAKDSSIPVLNGADESVSTVQNENDAVVNQVNQVASAFHDRIPSADPCPVEKSEVKKARVAVKPPCPTEHANCSDLVKKTKTYQNISLVPLAPPTANSSAKDLTVENSNLRDMVLHHVEFIGGLREELVEKTKEIASLQLERDQLKLCLEQGTFNNTMCLVRRRASPKANNSSTNNNSDTAAAEEHQSNVVSTTAVEAEHPRPIYTPPVLHTRYFGRRSKTVPSRALKRRYMGPPKVFPVKPPIFRTIESSAASSFYVCAAKPSVEKGERGQPRRGRKKRGRKTLILQPRKADFFTTDRDYYLPESKPPDIQISSEDINVPSWRIRPFPSFYQMEGTENINDDIFDRRHSKNEHKERRRKRWDIQRLREQKASKKIKHKRNSGHSNQRKPQSFFPDPRQIEFIEVTNQLPVLAFGHPIPLFQPCEFTLPWLCEEDSRRGHTSPSPKIT